MYIDEVPIFKSLFDSNVFVDLIKVNHPYFTRSLRYSLIFFDVFISMFQIACILDILYGPMHNLANRNLMVYSFQRIWISFFVSLGTTGFIYGTVTLLRWNEEEFLNVRNFTNYRVLNENLRKVKKIRYGIFYA